MRSPARFWSVVLVPSAWKALPSQKSAEPLGHHRPGLLALARRAVRGPALAARNHAGGPVLLGEVRARVVDGDDPVRLVGFLLDEGAEGVHLAVQHLVAAAGPELDGAREVDPVVVAVGAVHRVSLLRLEVRFMVVSADLVLRLGLRARRPHWVLGEQRAVQHVEDQ